MDLLRFYYGLFFLLGRVGEGFEMIIFYFDRVIDLDDEVFFFMFCFLYIVDF